MNARIGCSRLIDFSMASVLLFLMTYALVGEKAHEVLGCAMFVLMLFHMALNSAWYRNLGKGRYSVFRTVQTAVDFLILACMVCSMVSGIMLSRHVFASLGIAGHAAVARLAHLLASQWGFCLMSVHLGMHWSSIMVAFRTRKKGTAVYSPRTRNIILNGAAVLAAGYGAVAFVRRGVWEYLFLMTQFAFFDYEEPLPWFLTDYAAIMALFVFLGFQITKAAHKISFRNRD